MGKIRAILIKIIFHLAHTYYSKFNQSSEMAILQIDLTVLGQVGPILIELYNLELT